jgi:hypothetical protein
LALREKGFIRDEHFSFAGKTDSGVTSEKSIRSKDGSDTGDGEDFRGQMRTNNTGESTNDVAE